MLLPALLGGEPQSGAIWYDIFRQSPNVSPTNTRPSWRSAYLLAALLLLIAPHPFFAGNVWEPLLLNFFPSLVIIASVFAVSHSTTTRVAVFMLAVPVLGVRRLIHVFLVEAGTVFRLAAGAAFVAFVVVKLALYVLRQTTVTSDTIFAALIGTSVASRPEGYRKPRRRWIADAS